MQKAVIYIHGRGGDAAEAAHYQPLFPQRDVIGFAYAARSPWEARAEFPAFFGAVSRQYRAVSLIANSIGAFFAMHALPDKAIEQAYFISPVVDMEALIESMMAQAGVTEAALRDQGEIETTFGETLSWEYLSYVRSHPIAWPIPTRILYGAGDQLTSYETIAAFARKTSASLTIMPSGEHWFHTKEQMAFLDNWIKETA